MCLVFFGILESRSIEIREGELIVRFVDFIIFLAAIITAGSTFAMAVEMVVGWDDAVPVIEKVWDDSGIEQFLPADQTPAGQEGEAAGESPAPQ
jgi:hypothetical protein